MDSAFFFFFAYLPALATYSLLLLARGNDIEVNLVNLRDVGGLHHAAGLTVKFHNVAFALRSRRWNACRLHDCFVSHRKSEGIPIFHSTRIIPFYIRLPHIAYEHKTYYVLLTCIYSTRMIRSLKS